MVTGTETHIHAAETSDAEQKDALVIGVTSRKSDPEWLERWTGNYVKRLREYGATPVFLAPDAPAVLPDGRSFAPDSEGRIDPAILEALDGIIFAGGGDVHPRYFNQPLEGADEEGIDLKRDELELGLGKAALTRDMPVFGICRGCQVLNVAAGGGMVQHIDGHRSDTEAPVLHEVVVTPNTFVAGIVNVPAFHVNTYHHQAVDRNTLAPGFAPAAFDGSNGWIIEAWESRVNRWAVGVQWHPERMQDFGSTEEAAHRKLWDSFIEACREAKASRNLMTSGK